MFTNRGPTFSAISSTPGGGQIIAAPPTDFVVHFSQAYDPTTVTAGDFTVTPPGGSPIPADSFTPTDPTTITFHYATSPVTTEGGPYTIGIAAGSILALDQSPIQAFTSSFRFSALRLQVDSTNPPTGSVVELPFTTLDVHFNRPVNAASVSPSTLTVNQGHVTAATLLADGQTVEYTVSGLTGEGTLTVTVAAGALTDAAGNPNLAFSGSFFLDFGPGYPFPTPLQPVSPQGSFIYQGSLTSRVAAADDVDTYTIAVDAGQSIVVFVRPAAGLQPTLALSQGGTTLRSGVAGAPGQMVVLQPFVVPGNLGDGSPPQTYTITVGGTNGTTGNYTLQVVLNAVLAQPGSNSQGSAQDLGSAFLPVAAGSGRAAVVGTLNRDQLWFQYTLAAGQNSTLAVNGPAHVALVGPDGNVLATSHTSSLGDVISDFIAPASGIYYAVVGATGTGNFSLVVTRNGDLDTEPNTTLATAQDILSAGPGGTQYVFGNVGATGVAGASAHVLYFTDVAPSGTDPYMTAFAALGITPTVVPQASMTDPSAAYAAFATDLQAGGWDLVVFQQRFWSTGDFPSFSWTTPFLNYINGGGHVIYSTWYGSAPVSTTVAAAFDASFTGNINQTVVNQVGSSPIWAGVPNPLNLTLNSQIITSDIGLRAATGGTAIGRYANGDDALIIGNNGKTILSGFMPYLAGAAPATQLITNEINSLLARPDPADFYKMTLAAGQTIQVRGLAAGTPNSAMGDGLQLEVRLYGPSGELLATGNEGVLLNYQVPDGQDGTYSIEVLPSPGTPTPTQGDFFLTVQTTSGVLSPFVVTSVNPADGTFIQRGAVPTTVTVTFNHNIDLSTLQASDLTLDGVSATGYTVVSGNSVTFNVVGGLSSGIHYIHIAAGALRDVEGSSLADFTSTFIVDLSPPRVIGSSVQENDIITLDSTRSLTYTVTFSRPIVTTGLTSSAFSLVGTTGARTPASFSFDPTGTILTINYTNLPEDTYRLTLFSSSFVSIAGWHLDGKTTVGGVSVWPIPPGQSGDGTEGGNFFVDFITNIPTSAYPVPLQPVLPLGSAIYQGTPVSAFINPAGDTDSYTLNIAAGEKLTVLVHPNSPGLQAMIQVTDPGGSSVGSVTAPAAGQEALLETLAITTSGTYTITVSGAGGTTGAFQVQVFQNTALEASAHGGPPNATIATAQDLTPAFTPSFDGASGGAVIGHANAGGYQATVVTPTFEDISTTGTGVLQGTNDSVIQLTPAQLGTFTFTLFGHTYNNVYFNTNALIDFTVADSAYLNTDLTSSPTEACIAPLWTDYVAFDPSSVVYWQLVGLGTSQHLVIEWKNVQFYPGSAGLPFLTFEAVLNGDGTIQFNYQNVNNATRGTVGIKDAGTQGPNRLLLAFNNGPNQYVGNNLSTRISLTTASPAYYSFTVDQAEPVTLALKGLTAGGLTLQLQDGSGTTLASGVSAGNLDQVINRFPLTPGTYYARVTGTISTDYSLLVTRNVDFDTEPNDTMAHAQNITGTVGAVGYVVSGGSTSGAHVLYFNDVPQSGADPYMAAFAALGITPTVVPPGTTSDASAAYATFTTDLQAGGWDLVVFQQRYFPSGDYPSYSWIAPFVSYINGGGHVIYSTWVRTQVFGDPAVVSLYAALKATSTGNSNQTSVSQFGSSPIWDGITSPVTLTLDGTIGTSDIGLTAATGGQSVGRYANSDDALVVGNSGRTIFSGFMPYLAPAATATHLAQNEISFILGGITVEDWYSEQAAEGQTLNLFTVTPGAGPNGWGNTLSLHLQLFDPSGTLVAEGVKRPDGRNEQIIYTVPTGAAGLYTIRVMAENGTRGEYFLDPFTTSASPVALPAPVVSGDGAAVVATGVKALVGGGTQAEAAPLSSRPAALTTTVVAGAAGAPTVTVGSGSPLLWEVLSPRAAGQVDTIGVSGAAASVVEGQNLEQADPLAGFAQTPAVSAGLFGEASFPEAVWREASDTAFTDQLAAADDGATEGSALADHPAAALDAGAALAAVVALGGYWSQEPEEEEPRKRWTLRR
jgi:hypothetical protein